jgi:hypothetical protein
MANSTVNWRAGRGSCLFKVHTGLTQNRPMSALGTWAFSAKHGDVGSERGGCSSGLLGFLRILASISESGLGEGRSKAFDWNELN